LSLLSGGERQRVAVARTLAQDPPLLLFDEPTTGLDPERARAVADLIAETHDQFGKTVVVVTHHYEPFLRVQPRLVLVDAQTGQLRDTDEQGLRGHFEEGLHGTAVGPGAARGTASWVRAAAYWLEAPGRALGTLAGAIPAALAGWRRPYWKLKYLWHYLRMVAGGVSALYVVIAGVMLGFVFITFSFANLPYGHITVPLLTEEFLSATGYSMYRVVVPIMIAVLLAGKCGASASADLGARRLTHQFEALRNLGVPPSRYLYGPLVIALALGTPILTLLAFAASWYAALVAFLMAAPEASVAVFRRNFFATLLPPGDWLFRGTGWVLLKGVTTGILIAALSYEIGSRPKESSAAVSRDVGLTLFWASLGALMLHALYSFVEF
jgi:ABC-type transporter Mla maintaining outer membrane lipid asymmetry permease subunit MlaE